MARIPYPDPSTLSRANRALLEKLPPLNIFRMLAGSGASFQPFMALINAYLNEGVLDPQLRELVILRVGHFCGSAYELHQHERVARSIGVSEAQIAGVAGAVPSPLFSDAENLALTFSDDLAAHVKGDAALLDAAKTCFGDAGVQELIIIVGVYLMVCRYLETLEIEVEEIPLAVSGLDEIRAGIGGKAEAD